MSNFSQYLGIHKRIFKEGNYKFYSRQYLGLYDMDTLGYGLN